MYHSSNTHRNKAALEVVRAINRVFNASYLVRTSAKVANLVNNGMSISNPVLIAVKGLQESFGLVGVPSRPAQGFTFDFFLSATAKQTAALRATTCYKALDAASSKAVGRDLLDLDEVINKAGGDVYAAFANDNAPSFCKEVRDAVSFVLEYLTEEMNNLEASIVAESDDMKAAGIKARHLEVMKARDVVESEFKSLLPYLTTIENGDESKTFCRLVEGRASDALHVVEFPRLRSVYSFVALTDDDTALDSLLSASDYVTLLEKEAITTEEAAQKAEKKEVEKAEKAAKAAAVADKKKATFAAVKDIWAAVKDNENARLLVESALNDLGAALKEAKDGASAVAAVRAAFRLEVE